MSSSPDSAAQEFAPPKEDSDVMVPMASPASDPQTRRKSSEGDDIPLRNHRSIREAVRKPEESMQLRDGRPHRDTAKPSPKEADKHGRKKPGPKPWAVKPITKNDMVAKKEVIKEIEKFWGRGFIKVYIPKCHRPLVKRGRGTKRSMYRDHETDPRKWMPSVLKAILMVAKLTDDKNWLKKAMGDVVRYRIKHTGNRKPQLVTTDFDVIEDMLVKGWSVEVSFEIRYKHLLQNRKANEETDEDIEHILNAGSGHEDGSEEDDDEDEDMDEEADEDMDDEEEEEEEEAGNDMDQGLSSSYLLSSGYIQAPQYPIVRQQQQHPKAKKPQNQTQQHNNMHSMPNVPNMYGYRTPMPGYGPPMNGYGQPVPGYGGYGGYGDYGPQYRGPQYPFKPNHEFSHPGMHQYPPTHPMAPSPSYAESEDRGRQGNGNQRSRFSPFRKSKRGDRQNMYGIPSHPMGRLTLEAPEQPNPLQGPRPKIKHEEDEQSYAYDEFNGPSNCLGSQGNLMQSQGSYDEDDEEYWAAEMAKAEAEKKRAEAQMQMIKRKKNKGTARNPMNLD